MGLLAGFMLDRWDIAILGLKVHSFSLIRSRSCFCFLRHSACFSASLIAFYCRSALDTLEFADSPREFPLADRVRLSVLADFCRSGLNEGSNLAFLTYYICFSL